MEKEIFIKKIIEGKDEYEIFREMHRGRKDGHRIHKHDGRKHGHGHHQEECCNTDMKKHHSFRPDRFKFKMKTKLFTSKEDLVEYVNKVGELGNKVDIYKIEDNLYKVVVFERHHQERKEEKEEK